MASSGKTPPIASPSPAHDGEAALRGGLGHHGAINDATDDISAVKSAAKEGTCLVQIQLPPHAKLGVTFTDMKSDGTAAVKLNKVLPTSPLRQKIPAEFVGRSTLHSIMIGQGPRFQPKTVNECAHKVYEGQGQARRIELVLVKMKETNSAVQPIRASGEPAAPSKKKSTAAGGVGKIVPRIPAITKRKMRDNTGGDVPPQKKSAKEAASVGQNAHLPPQKKDAVPSTSRTKGEKTSPAESTPIAGRKKNAQCLATASHPNVKVDIRANTCVVKILLSKKAPLGLTLGDNKAAALPMVKEVSPSSLLRGQIPAEFVGNSVIQSVAIQGRRLYPQLGTECARMIKEALALPPHSGWPMKIELSLVKTNGATVITPDGLSRKRKSPSDQKGMQEGKSSAVIEEDAKRARLAADSRGVARDSKKTSDSKAAAKNTTRALSLKSAVENHQTTDTEPAAARLVSPSDDDPKDTAANLAERLEAGSPADSPERKDSERGEEQPKEPGEESTSAEMITMACPHCSEVKRFSPKTAAASFSNHMKACAKKKEAMESSGRAKAAGDAKPPSSILRERFQSLPASEQRKRVQKGMRLKVRFVEEIEGPNKEETKKEVKWYAGVIDKTLNGGKKVQIQYDDGTSETATFPDEDIVVEGLEDSAPETEDTSNANKESNSGTIEKKSNSDDSLVASTIESEAASSVSNVNDEEDSADMDQPSLYSFGAGIKVGDRCFAFVASEWAVGDYPGEQEWSPGEVTAKQGKGFLIELDDEDEYELPAALLVPEDDFRQFQELQSSLQEGGVVLAPRWASETGTGTPQWHPAVIQSRLGSRARPEFKVCFDEDNKEGRTKRWLLFPFRPRDNACRQSIQENDTGASHDPASPSSIPAVKDGSNTAESPQPAVSSSDERGDASDAGSSTSSGESTLAAKPSDVVLSLRDPEYERVLNAMCRKLDKSATDGMDEKALHQTEIDAAKEIWEGFREKCGRFLKRNQYDVRVVYEVDDEEAQTKIRTDIKMRDHRRHKWDTGSSHSSDDTQETDDEPKDAQDDNAQEAGNDASDSEDDQSDPEERYSTSILSNDASDRPEIGEVLASKFNWCLEGVRRSANLRPAIVGLALAVAVVVGGYLCLHSSTRIPSVISEDSINVSDEKSKRSMVAELSALMGEYLERKRAPAFRGAEAEPLLEPEADLWALAQKVDSLRHLLHYLFLSGCAIVVGLLAVIWHNVVQLKRERGALTGVLVELDFFAQNGILDRVVVGNIMAEYSGERGEFYEQ
ncbi:hypothetical protein ACHAXT_004949 [Thalassiosira profunda]